MLKYRFLLPDQLPAVYEAVKDYLPDSARSPNAFAAVYYSKDSMFFEVGDFQGVFWLSNIVPGWKANVHIVLWDEAVRGQHSIARHIISELADRLRLRRIAGYIPATFIPAIKYAERVGFRYEGVHSLLDRYNNELVDVHSYALLEEDIHGWLSDLRPTTPANAGGTRTG